ncbi:MAG TPA: hypothetical protein VGE47_12760, partial [Burkholderiaceae bacterium]
MKFAAAGCLLLALFSATALTVAAPAAPTLEALYRATPYRGEAAKQARFSHSGRYLAYLWSPFGEPGSDLNIYDTQTGKTLRITSPALMAAFDAPEDLARYEKKLKQRNDERSERQAREEAQAAYLRGAQVDLNQWDSKALAKVKADAAAKQLRDDAKKAADKAEADAEKRAMAELAARRAGKPAPAAASAPAAPASAASAPGKDDWEWRDELAKQRAKNKLKPSDLYPGVKGFVWAHQKDELIFEYRGNLMRVAGADLAAGRYQPLVATQRPLKIVAYSGDDLGFVYTDETRVLAGRFAAAGVQVLNRELINADDAERKWKIESTVLSEDGRWMSLVARAPLGTDDKPA